MSVRRKHQAKYKKRLHAVRTGELPQYITNNHDVSVAARPTQLESGKSGNTPQGELQPVPKVYRLKRRIIVWGAFSALIAICAIAISEELQTSNLQARYLSSFDRELSFRLESGHSPSIRYPTNGPYDQRLGYVGLPDFIQRLKRLGFEVIPSCIRYSI
jgi:hypothetical protein